MNTQFMEALIAPHAPTMLEAEMDGILSPVNESLKQTGKELMDKGIDVVIAASTHWITDDFKVDASPFHRTVYDYYGFRTSLEYDVPGHPELADLVLKTGESEFAYPRTGKRGADHAVTIPMHFLFPEKNVPVVPVSVGGTPEEALLRGRVIRRAAEKSGLNVLFMASGSLSHDLEFFTTGRHDSAHQLFDRTVMHFLEQGKGMSLTDMDENLLMTGKPEGWFRDLFMLLGFMGTGTRGHVQAYETLPGVGLAVLRFSGSGSG